MHMKGQLSKALHTNTKQSVMITAILKGFVVARGRFKSSFFAGLHSTDVGQVCYFFVAFIFQF